MREEARRLYEAGTTQSDIAKRLGVSGATISTWLTDMGVERRPNPGTRYGNGMGWGGPASGRPARGDKDSRRRFEKGNPGGPGGGDGTGALPAQRTLDRREARKPLIEAYEQRLFDAAFRDIPEEERGTLRKRGKEVAAYKLFEVAFQEEEPPAGDKIRVMALAKLHEIFAAKFDNAALDENGQPIVSYAVVPEQAESMEAWAREAQQYRQSLINQDTSDAKSGDLSQDHKPSF